MTTAKKPAPQRSQRSEDTEVETAAAHESNGNDEQGSSSRRTPLSGRSGRTVTVACKMPNGMVLQLQRPMERQEDTRDGPRPRTYWVKYGKMYFVRGPSDPVGTRPKGFPKAPMIEGGYAITKNIPADFWAEWAEQNKKSDYFVAPGGAEHGVIFAYQDIDDTVAAAMEQETLLSGFEPINPDTDSKGRPVDKRMPQRLAHGLHHVTEDA